MAGGSAFGRGCENPLTRPLASVQPLLVIFSRSNPSKGTRKPDYCLVGLRPRFGRLRWF